MSTHRADIPPEPTADLVTDKSGRVDVPDAQSTQTRVITTDPSGRGEPGPGFVTRVGIPRAYNLSRDRVRWAAVWAGVITTLTSSLLLGLLGLAVSLTADNVGVRGMVQFAAIWGFVATLVAFFLGGYVAGGAAAVFDRRWGALNGALVFAVTLPLVLWLTTTGIGAALGIVANYAAAVAIDPAQLRGFIEGTPSVGAPSLGREAVETLWIGFAGLLLALAMSMLGGALGTRRSVDLPTTNGRGVR